MHVLVVPSNCCHRHDLGLGLVCREHARALADHGHDVGVAVVDLHRLPTRSRDGGAHQRFQIEHGNDGPFQSTRIHGWELPFLPRGRGALWSWFGQRAIEAYMNRYGRPDLIYAHGAQYAGFATHKIKSEHAIPMIVAEDASGPLSRPLRRWQDKRIQAVLNAADMVMTDTDRLARLIEVRAGIPHVETLPNAVDTAFFAPPPSKTDARTTFLTVGSLEIDSGVDGIIRALASLACLEKGVDLEIGGDGPERDAFVELAETLGIGTHVRFLGRLDRDGTRAAMHRADALVLANHRENSDSTTIEALSCGLPVVASRTAAAEDILTEETGRLVPIGNILALTGAMAEIARDRDHWRDRSEAIRAHAIARFSTDAIARRIDALYYRMTDGPTRQGQADDAERSTPSLQYAS